MARKEGVVLTNMCLLFNNKGEILVQDRLSKDWPGITFPGGHLEKDESIYESMIREFKEETGLTLAKLKYCGILHWTPLSGVRYITFCFTANAYEGEIKDSKEGHVFWLKIEDLKKENLSYDLEEILPVFFNDEIGEYYCLNDDNNKPIMKKLY